jgi:hypothetical protein
MENNQQIKINIKPTIIVVKSPINKKPPDLPLEGMIESNHVINKRSSFLQINSNSLNVIPQQR